MNDTTLIFKTADIIEAGGLAKSLSISADDLFNDPALHPDRLLSIEVELSVGSDAILLQASISGGWQMPCSGCLKEHSTTYVTTAEETYAADALEIDISETLREVALLELPQRSLCRPDCRGLCDRCGKDLNEGSCQCPPQNTTPLVSLNRLKE